MQLLHSTFMYNLQFFSFFGNQFNKLEPNLQVNPPMFEPWKLQMMHVSRSE